ncbi:MAG: class I SAM-dependent methyltransferase [Thermoanaerobaculia bacterium]|nr:MAG: class I SAM-dependent methyltransferase [Thermoanaerobaculia bacterium]
MRRPAAPCLAAGLGLRPADSPIQRRARARACGSRGGEFCLSIGGGPRRIHPRLLNLNLAPFRNVDVVATAYALPHPDGSVPAIHCEAVVEHLEFPDRAVAEMYRVLRAGGYVYSNTPFLQPYHAYPDHYQNFTLTGHHRLFERAGFLVVEAGVAVGPSFMLRDLLANYCRHALPGGRWGKVLARVVELLLLPLPLLDRVTSRGATAHAVCSTTYLLAQKPAEG